MSDPDWWEVLLQPLVQNLDSFCVVFTILHVVFKITMLVCLKEVEGKRTW